MRFLRASGLKVIVIFVGGKGLNHWEPEEGLWSTVTLAATTSGIHTLVWSPPTLRANVTI